VDDEWLVSQCLFGKTAYWNVLIQRYHDRLFESVHSLGKHLDVTIEIVELTFIRAKTDLSSFNLYQSLLSHCWRSAERTVEPFFEPFFLWLLKLSAQTEARMLKRAKGK
jgi:hypothetical protein